MNDVPLEILVDRRSGGFSGRFGECAVSLNGLIGFSADVLCCQVLL
jgi:hypothetical protein